MGFFSGSSSATSTTTQTGKLIDTGVFSQDKSNQATLGIAEDLRGSLQDSPALDPIVFGESFDKFTQTGDLLGENFLNSILNNAQGVFNQRGLAQITQNEALKTIAPFQIEAQNANTNTLNAIGGIRQGDFFSQLDLLKESRPDLLIDQTTTTTGSTSPSVLSKFNSVLGTVKNIQGIAGEGGGLAGLLKLAGLG